MSILTLLVLLFAAVIAAAVVIVRWALSHIRAPPGFPMDHGATAGSLR